MLEKISNINPQDKFKSGTKVLPTNPYIIHANDYNLKKKDSALFSPLAKLMSKINWHILNLEYPSDDEMLFHFLVDDIEFFTIINFNELYTNSHHEFSIIKSGFYKNSKVNFEASIEVQKDEIAILEFPDRIEISHLKRFFNRMEINEFNIAINQKFYDEITLGIENGIYSELNYILKVIYTFITTKHPDKIKNHFILKSQPNIPIIIQQIDIINTD
ncbi:MAG: hypothetical protein IPM32_07245 [Ignavibacteriae bacterium]|nr:hypothetical protein [Ignavibacteriota bacterium]